MLYEHHFELRMNTAATVKSFENLAILCTLHLHTKQLVIYEGCKVLIKLLASAHTLPINIQPHKVHKINYENSLINLYNPSCTLHQVVGFCVPSPRC